MTWVCERITRLYQQWDYNYHGNDNTQCINISLSQPSQGNGAPGEHLTACLWLVQRFQIGRPRIECRPQFATVQVWLKLQSTTVQDHSGTCLTEQQEILNWWTKYCSELYNHKTNGDPSVLNCPQTKRTTTPSFAKKWRLQYNQSEVNPFVITWMRL